uniref:Uncharacterized protein n=1 Tax=Taeniopygia guttata TaxID=59729 RepID=H0YQ76_TAEGU
PRDSILFPGSQRSPSQRLTHAAGQVAQHIVAAQAAQHGEQLPHGGPAGAASRPLLQQRGRGVGQPLQPPDLQEAAAQRLRQRRPVRGRGRPRVQVEAEAAADAVVERYHGHGLQVRQRAGAGAGSGLRWGRGHRAALRLPLPGTFAPRPAPPLLRPAAPLRPQPSAAGERGGDVPSQPSGEPSSRDSPVSSCQHGPALRKTCDFLQPWLSSR